MTSGTRQCAGEGMYVCARASCVGYPRRSEPACARTPSLSLSEHRRHHSRSPGVCVCD